MGAIIKCCHHCVAPKRHPGCHGHCQEYITQKAEYEQIKAKHDLKRNVDSAIYGDRGNKVYKAMREREKAKKGKW